MPHLLKKMSNKNDESEGYEETYINAGNTVLIYFPGFVRFIF